MIIPYLIAAVGGYLAGAIPTGYLVVKQQTGQDIREFGSGGTGATNVRRVAGGKAALVVLAFDLVKGLLPVLVSKWLLPDEHWLHVLVAFTAVLGHSKSIFLGFSGGKSAATGLGGMIGLAWAPALIVGLIAFLVVKFTRYQSLGSIAASFAAPVMLYLFHEPTPYTLYSILASTYVIFMHKANIGRLLSGTENRSS